MLQGTLGLEGPYQNLTVPESMGLGKFNHYDIDLMGFDNGDQLWQCKSTSDEFKNFSMGLTKTGLVVVGLNDSSLCWSRATSLEFVANRNAEQLYSELDAKSRAGDFNPERYRARLAWLLCQGLEKCFVPGMWDHYQDTDPTWLEGLGDWTWLNGVGEYPNQYTIVDFLTGYLDSISDELFDDDADIPGSELAFTDCVLSAVKCLSQFMALNTQLEVNSWLASVSDESDFTEFDIASGFDELEAIEQPCDEKMSHIHLVHLLCKKAWSKCRLHNDA